jgi:hypothetical protein
MPYKTDIPAAPVLAGGSRRGQGGAGGRQLRRHAVAESGSMRRFRSWDGTELAYRVAGYGPPLVCVPGGPGQAVEYPASFAATVDEFLARRPATPGA